MKKQPRDQQREREYRFFQDQHGREWGANVEKSTGHPCGPLEPQFTAPYIPPQSYLEIVGRTNQLRINYDRLLEDASEGHDAWQKRLEVAARGIHHTDADRFIKEPTPELLRIAGEKPVPLDLIIACRQGKSRWVLGLPDPRTGEPMPRPSWADEVLPEKKAKVREFTDDYGDGAAEEDEPREWPTPDAFVGLHHLIAKSYIRQMEPEDAPIAEAYLKAEQAQAEPRPTVVAALEEKLEAFAVPA